MKNVPATTQPITLNPRIFLSKIFLIVLVLKILCSYMFASHYLSELFTPFINWFVDSKFDNPWEYFYSINQFKMFPYPPVMLWIMAFPRICFDCFLSNDWRIATHLHFLIMRIPLLFFDISIFYLLLKIFPTKEKTVLYAYWVSPIIFYVNYIHGQLDIIPTAFFFYAIYFLTKKKYFYSVVLYALSAGCKNHIFVFLPFFLLFMYKQRMSIIRLAINFFLFIALYFLFVSPYIDSHAFREMVFNTIEQKRIYEFVLPVSNTLSIIVCPTIIFCLFMKFASFKKLNKEILLMFCGIVLACLVIFVTPMPGWFLWSLPFLIYFYINNYEYSRAPFLLYNLIYISYFLIFFERNIFSVINWDKYLTQINNLALSLLLSSIGFITIWMYQCGIKRNEELKLKEKPLLIGIGGDSGTGKHSLYSVLEKLLGEAFSVPVFGDNFHKWERGNENWNVYTHLNPSSNKLHQEFNFAVALQEGRQIEIVEYDHKTGTFTNPKTVGSNKFIFFVGLHPFYLSGMRELIDIKIFMEPDENLRRYWKIKRDVLQRGYEQAKVMEQITLRSEDNIRFIKPQKDFADLIVKYLPLEEIDLNGLTQNEVKLKVKYQLDNSINLDNLLSNLSKITTLKVTPEHLDNLIQFEIEVEGEISASEVQQVAYSLGLNFDELLFHKPQWLSGYDGIAQLIFMLIYNYKMKVQ